MKRPKSAILNSVKEKKQSLSICLGRLLMTAAKSERRLLMYSAHSIRDPEIYTLRGNTTWLLFENQGCRVCVGVCVSGERWFHIWVKCNPLPSRLIDDRRLVMCYFQGE